MSYVLKTNHGYILMGADNRPVVQSADGHVVKLKAPSEAQITAYDKAATEKASVLEKRKAEAEAYYTSDEGQAVLAFEKSELKSAKADKAERKANFMAKYKKK